MEILIAILSLCISVIAIIVSYYTFFRAHRTSLQPMLIFSNQELNKENNVAWYVENVGNGPALNIQIAGGDTNLNWDFENVVLIPALSKTNIEPLQWLKSTGALVATYTDISAKQYTTICHHNKNTISNKNLYPEIKPQKFFYQLKRKKIIQH